MNTRNHGQSLGCIEVASYRKRERSGLKLLTALVLCMGSTGWCQVPGLAFPPSRQTAPAPNSTVNAPETPRPLTAFALRQRMRHSQTSISTAQSATTAAQTAAATLGSAPYSYVYINIPNSAYVQPNAINNAGWVVGYYADLSYNLHGFIWQDGTLRYVDYPGAVQTNLTGINNLGQIIGQYLDASFNSHVATYSPESAAWRDLPPIPGSWYTYVGSAMSLNDQGEALGCAYSVTLPLELTWIWHTESQAYSYLTAAAAAPGMTCGEEMNNSRTVVGLMDTAYGSPFQNDFYLFLGDRISGFPIAPQPSSFQQGSLIPPLGLNNRGILAGTVYFSSDNSVLAFLRDRDGVFSIVNNAAWPQTYLTGLNDFGVLIGDVYDPAYGLGPGFLAYPIGGPASAQHAP